MFPHILHAAKPDAEVGANQVTYAFAKSHLAPPLGCCGIDQTVGGWYVPANGNRGPPRLTYSPVVIR